MKKKAIVVVTLLLATSLVNAEHKRSFNLNSRAYQRVMFGRGYARPDLGNVRDPSLPKDGYIPYEPSGKYGSQSNGFEEYNIDYRDSGSGRHDR